jgi:putative transposase
MARGFVYLVVVLDWFSRRALAGRVSITMEVDFCVEAVEEALGRYGNPKSSIQIRGASLPAACSRVSC